MASAILQSILSDLSRINTNIAEAKEMIAFLRAAGEPTATQEAEVRALEIRKAKWDAAAREMGYLG